MSRRIGLVTLALASVTIAAALAQVAHPKPTSTTPAGCLAEVRAFTTAKQSEVPSPSTPGTTPQARSQMLQQISAARVAMTKECAAQFDVATTADKELDALATLYLAAGMIDQAKAASDRELALKDLSPADRAAAILTGINVAWRVTVPNADRAWRVANEYPKVEALIDQLEQCPAVTFDQQWAIRAQMEGTYRSDDIDAGILKHGEWMLAAAKTFTPEQRKKFGLTIVFAHINMAEAYAGQNMTDKAVELLRAAKTDWKNDVAGVDDRVDPTLHRYELVGTPGAAIAAPVWLNAPAGTTSLAMPGHVTLLEFTAHWCGPCRESYPGINRLRERFKNDNFRVAMVTRLWGYFGAERNLAGDAEIAHDKDYFAEHGLDVPVAVGGQVTPSLVDGKVVYKPGPDPNDTAYGVGGIPQIQLIDKKGTIRLIMVGYDKTNEEKLAKIIEGLLKDK